MNENEYININKVAEAKGLKSNRSLRLEINKPESKYIAREVKVNGGTSYEILYSSLEPEIQQKLREGNTKSTALVPLNYQPTTFISESARLTSLARLDIVKALLNYRKRFSTKKEADSMFLDLYNSGMYLPKVFKFIGTISIGTLHRWVKSYERYENAECLIPQYKFNKQGEYNTILTDEMKHILLRFLLHQNKFNYGKAIKLTKEILRKQGYENLPCDLTFKRYAENFRKNNYAEWVLKREGMKAYHDKVEPYIERDISKIEVGDIIIADGHVLNFQVINPFTGKPTRATLVGFLDWKSTALVGYEIMMTENTQCIEDLLKKLDIHKLISDILDATQFGFQPLEIMWKKEKTGQILPAKTIAKPPEWFCFDDENNLKFRTKSDYYGEIVPDKKFLLAQNNPSYNNPYGERTLSRVFWNVTFKKGGMKFWVVFTEKYGMPHLIGKHPRGATKEETNTLADMLEDMVQDAIAVIPDDSSVEIQEANKSSSAEIYEKLIDKMNAEISKAILGQTLTTEIGSTGSYAAANTHMAVRQDIVDSDKKLVESVINQLIQWVYEINFSKEDVPKFELYEPEDVDLTLAQRDKLSLKFSPTLGIKCNGKFLILSSLAFLKTGKECTLSDVLEENVSEKYFLSSEAIQRILSKSA